MRTQRFFAAILVALMALALGIIAPQPVAAAADSPITFAITAVVDDVQDWDHVLGIVEQGTIITGTYTYNAAAVNTSQASSTGAYWHTTAPYGIRLNINGRIVETDPQNVLFTVMLTNNQYGRDAYKIISQNNRPVAGLYSINWISWLLEDPSQSVLKNINLTKTAPRLSDWQQSNAGLLVEGAPLDTNSEFELYVRAHVTKVQKI